MNYKGKIGNKLIITFVLFVTIFVGSTGWFLYRSAKDSLDNELGGKLIAIAQAVVTQIDSISITYLSPGDEGTKNYENLKEKIKKVKQATNVKRIYIFDRNNKSLVDTDENIPIGTEYIKLRFNKSELENLWNGNCVHTILFKGEDGEYYKSGYAPIKDNNSVVAAVGVDTSATIMSAIRAFGRNVVIFAIVSILITIAIGFLFAKTITNPIDKLVKSAEEISKGNFNNEINIKSNDELGYLGYSMDNMRKAIIQRDNRLKMMLAGIAHEIRNPLGGIEIFAGLLSEDLQGTSKEYVDKIIKEVRNLNDIVTQFLEYAKPTEPIKEDVELLSIIDEICFILAPELQKRNVKFISEITDGKIKVFVDPKQIKSVFMNIIKNSIQAMSDGGEIKLKSDKTDNLIVITVSDNGLGIASENLGKIFDPFFTTKEKGAGLGLAIVKKLVEDNNGKIEVQSKVGEGTTFTIYLPEA
ncbi:TPA: HAMP domain-containing histidine kinase [Candidatus Poribacteria bacterium]|nr:HAMP domain-containing histidine kinase [Candidatus Poribacteria bacterium]